jgi:multiple sugar transport system permease protein
MAFVSRRREGSLRRNKILSMAASYLILVIVVILVVFPIYWMAITSLKTPKEIYRVPSLWPHLFTKQNYHDLIVKKHFLTNIKNSLIVASMVTIISLIVSSFAAYSIVRFKYRFKGVIGRIILFAYLTPTSLLFIPLSIVIARLRLGNSLYGLIIVYLTFSLPLSTWLLQGYFRAVPRELEEQAMVDGSTRMGALFRILLPLSAPGLAAVSIFTFTGAWNELLLALIFITSSSKYTVPLGINYLITSDVLPWGTLMAGAVLSSLPVIILYFLAQRFMIGGMTSGSVKG